MKTLLIVDDQKGIRLLLEEIFQREGYQTRLAANGLTALQEVEREVPNCVLLDMNMPGIDGMEVLKRLRSGWPGIPVIMMTAYSDKEMIERAVELGAKKVVVKPFDIYEIREAVNQVLKNEL